MHFGHTFHSFKHLAEFVEEMDELVPLAIAAGPIAAATIVHRATVKKFGHYQNEYGPFDKWEPLKKDTKSERVRLGFTEDDPLLRSGELRDSYEVKYSGLMAGVGSALGKAEGMELGDPIKNVPARSTLGAAFAENEAEAFEAACLPLMGLLTTGKLPMRRSKWGGAVEDVTD